MFAKRLIKALFLVFLLCPLGNAFAAITYTTQCVVNKCNTGYYAVELMYDWDTKKSYYTKCVKCPDMLTAGGTYQNGLTNTSAETGGITSCYMPTGVRFSDNSGTYEFTSNCSYTE